MRIKQIPEKSLEEITWKPRKKTFVDAKGRNVKVRLIKKPSHYSTTASAGNPLAYQGERLAREAAMGTIADAYTFGNSRIFENHRFPDARWSPAEVEIGLYKIIRR